MAENNSADKDSTTFQKASFLIYLLAVSAAFLFMLQSFLMPIFLAAVFTGLTYPIYFWLLMKTGKRVLSSFLTLMSILLVLVLPFIAVGFVAYQQAVGFFSSLDIDALRVRFTDIVLGLRDRYPALLKKVNPQTLSSMAFDAFQSSLQFILKHSADISLSVAGNLFSFFLMLLIMFYFYIDGHRILQRLIKWSPLKDEYERILISKFVSVSKGTLKGILVVGAIQGLIGAILFVSVGLHSPIFLGVLMIFSSIVPVTGTAIVWIPVAIFFLVQHQIWQALVVAIVGASVISSVDNLLRPKIVGKDIKMHDLMVLLSTLGGLGMFGLAGFIIGPIIASLFLSIWNMFEEIFAEELAQNSRIGFRTQKISQLLRERPMGTEPGESEENSRPKSPLAEPPEPMGPAVP